MHGQMHTQKNVALAHSTMKGGDVASLVEFSPVI